MSCSGQLKKADLLKSQGIDFRGCIEEEDYMNAEHFYQVLISEQPKNISTSTVIQDNIEMGLVLDMIGKHCPKGSLSLRKRMNFGKFPKGGGSFPIQKISLQFFALETALLVMNFRKKLQHFSRKPKILLCRSPQGSGTLSSVAARPA